MTLRKKYLCLALVVIMLTAMLPVAGAADAIVISTAEQLAAVTGSGDYQLGDNITITDAWTPLPAFSGTFDGNEYTISGLTDALFREIAGGTVENLCLDVSINKFSSVQDEQKAAALALDMSGGLVQNVHVSGTISMSAYRHNVAGLIAFMGKGTVDGCSFNGTVYSKNSHSNTVPNDKGGTDRINTLAAGIVGMTWFQPDGDRYGEIINCAMNGNIVVDGAYWVYVGGIVADANIVNFNGMIDSCFSKADISVVNAAHVYAGGIAGHASFQTEFTKCVSSSSIYVSAIEEADVGGILGNIHLNANIFNCLSVGGSYTAIVDNVLEQSCVGAIAGSSWADGGGRLYIENNIAIGNTLNGDLKGSISGYRGGNVQFKNDFYDSEHPSAGDEDAVNMDTVNVVKVTADDLRNRASYDNIDPDCVWKDFDKIWIIPEGLNPTLLWAVRNLYNGSKVVDVNTANVAYLDGFQSGDFIGVVGEDMFATIQAAMSNSTLGNMIYIASNVTDFTFGDVTLTPDGGTITGITVADSGKVMLPSVSKRGYNFGGWKVGSTTYKAGEIVAVSAPTEFVAQWSVISSGGSNTPAPTPEQPVEQVKEHADGSKSVTTEKTTTAEDGTVTKTVNQTTTGQSGAVSETQTKTSTSKDGTTATTEKSTVVKGADGAVVSSTVVNSTTKTDGGTGVSATTGSTTTTGTSGTSTTAFAEVKANTAVVDQATGAALLDALKQSESAANESGAPVSSSIVIAAATGEAQTSGAVSLPQSFVSSIASETTASVVINTDAGQIELSNEALSSIAAAGAGAASITVSIREVENNELSSEQQGVSSAGKAFVIEITATDDFGNTSYIHSLGNGEQVVRLPYTPEAGEDVSNLIVYYVDENGVSQKMGGTYNAVEGYMEFRSSHNSLYLIVNESSRVFTDVKLGDWYYSTINYMLQNGLMNGMTDTEFMPGYSLNRAMFVTILYRLDGQNSSAETDRFSDVPSGKWYSTAVGWATKRGLVTGFEDGTFRPMEPITREQMAAILYRYAIYKGYDVDLSSTLSEFSDAGKVSAWIAAPVKWAVAEGLLTGMTETTLEPSGTATRAQVATVIKRLCDKYE